MSVVRSNQHKEDNDGANGVLGWTLKIQEGEYKRENEQRIRKGG